MIPTTYTPAHITFLHVYDVRYCGDECFKRCWGDHNRLQNEQVMAPREQPQQKQLQRESELNDDDDDAIVGTCDVDDDAAKPKSSAPMLVTTNPASAAGMNIASSISPGGVRIIGAMCPSGAMLNGVYEATSEMSGDMPVYVKVGDNGMCMEYYAPNDQWQVKESEHKGTDLCLAYCSVPIRCLPEQCPAGQWYVWSGTKLVPQSAVTSSPVSKEEVGAYREEQEREAARVVKGRHNVRITGTTGVKAGLINGVYKPTNEMSGNVSVYQKVVGVQSGNVWLEYNAHLKMWQVKLTANKGAHLCWARCIVSVKRLPQECPAGKWEVWDDTKWNQSAVKVRRHK